MQGARKVLREARESFEAMRISFEAVEESEARRQAAFARLLTDARMPEALRDDLVFVEAMHSLGYRITSQQIGDTTVYQLEIHDGTDWHHEEHGTWELMMRVIRKYEGLNGLQSEEIYGQRVEDNRAGGEPVWPNPQEGEQP